MHKSTRNSFSLLLTLPGLEFSILSEFSDVCDTVTIYTMSLVTQETDPGNDGDKRLGRVIICPPPSSASVLMIRESFITPALPLATPAQQLSRKMVAIHISRKMFNTNSGYCHFYLF